MPASHLLSFYGSSNPTDGYGERQQTLHQSAEQVGKINVQHPWNKTLLSQTDFYQQHRHILDQERGAGFWLWKPYLILKILNEIPENDFLMYADVGRQIFRDPKIGNRFTRPLQPLIDYAENHGGIFPGIYIPIYGRLGMWTKRDCFVLMDCDEPKYWDSPKVQAGFNVWKNTSAVRDFITEWLEYCKDPRILTDQPNQCGLDNLPDFKDHRHDQSVLTNLLIKKNIGGYGDPKEEVFKRRDIGYIINKVAVDKLLKAQQPIELEQIGNKYQSGRVASEYIPFYTLHMEERRQDAVDLLEIRTIASEETKMWLDYFPNGNIATIHPGKSVTTAANQNDRSILHHPLDPTHRPTLEILYRRLAQAGKKFDFIIEAGSGLMRDQQLAIGILFPLLKPGGIIIIEKMENSLKAGQGDLNPNRVNSTLQLIRRINLHNEKISSHYFTIAECRQLKQLVDTAGIHWNAARTSGVAMIRRKY